MLEINSFQNIEEIIEENCSNNLETLYHTLFDEIKDYLNLEPIQQNFKILIINKPILKELNIQGIFNIGVERYTQDNVLVLKFNENHKELLNLIFLREIYNQFVPDKLRNHEVIQIVINQIIMNQFSKHPSLNKWRSLIRGKIKDHDLLSKGVNRMFAFDRLEKIFNLKVTDAPYDPIQFFFRYLRENITLISEKIKDFHQIIFEEFMRYISKSLKNDEVVESIRCLIKIFYNVKTYESVFTYKNLFQKFKTTGLIKTDLSLQKFMKTMDWIKRYSYLAPSYQLKWNTINICLISSFLRFNPIIANEKIYKIINKLPFFVASKISHDSLALEVSGYIVIPKIYLKDFHSFIKKLEENNYIIHKYCLLWNTNNHYVNLNYLKEYSINHRLINPNHSQYDAKNEIEFTTALGTNYYKNTLTLLDFLILDRIRFYSVSGLGFERKNETLHDIKSDLLNTIISERAQIKKLRKILKKFSENVELKTNFIQFLEANKNFGFFYIKEMLEKTIGILQFIEVWLHNNPNIKNSYQVLNKIRNFDLSHIIEQNLLIKNMSTNFINIKGIISLYFKSRPTYNEEVNRLKQFSKLINTTYNLKIFSLKSLRKILTDDKAINQIYKKKEEKLKTYYGKWKLYKITSQEIEDTVKKLLGKCPPIIKPLLINTIIFPDEKDYLQLILIDSSDIRKLLNKLKYSFPRVLINNVQNMETNEKLIYVEISTPNLTQEEKLQLYSILYNNFADHLLYGKSYLWCGMIPAISRKNFYDFDNKQFFYTKDLFEQFFLYVKKLLGENLNHLSANKNQMQNKFWSKEKYFIRFLKKIESHDKKESVNYNLANLNNLLEFNRLIKKNLINIEKFKQLKLEHFYKNHVKSIKCIPAFQHFGFEQFFLYIHPTNMNSIDLKLLLSNTFQKIKYPASVDETNSLFIKFIMPFCFPNMKYINWLRESKKIIREYLAFSITKIYQLLHFNNNLTSKGWCYDTDKFKIYTQMILFKSDYNIQIPKLEPYNLKEKNDSYYYTPDTVEFKALTEIYSCSSLDLKSYLGANKLTKEKQIIDLIKKGLVFPYLIIKNIGLENKIHLIIPNLEEEKKETLIKIFSYFNAGFIYEIEGEFYIKGFDEGKRFENGLMIKLYFPKCEIGEFEKLFELLFEYLDINYYLILNDLVDGSNLIKSIFGNLDYLKSYNPLKNLKWNKKDKIWTNNNIFSKENGFIYPDLINKENE